MARELLGNIKGDKGDKGDKGEKGRDGVITPEQYSIINNKIDKGEVTPDDLSPGLLELINNSDGTPFNILSIPRDSSVTPEKTTFLKVVSNNRFNKEDVVTGSFIGEDGTIGNTASVSYAKFFSVTPGKTYYFYGFLAVSRYGASNNFLMRDTLLVTGQAYTIPEGCVRIQLNFNQSTYLNTRRINEGSVLLPYDDYKLELEKVTVSDNTITPTKTTFLNEVNTVSKLNIFNKNNITSGGYYDPVSLLWVENVGFSQSEFMPCETSDTLIESSMGTFRNFIVFKNESGVIFAEENIGSSPEPRIITVPEGAVSFSAHMRNEFIETFVIVKNNDYPDKYVGFGETLKTVQITNKELNEYIVELVKDNLNFDTQSRFKTANFIGDSITWGYSPVDGTRLPVIWVDLIKESLGIETVRNYGVNGSTLSSALDGGGSPMVDRYTSMSNDADLVCVFGGRNDWNRALPLGTIDDSDKFTYYGALKVMMDGLYDKYPTATIVFFTPLHGSDSTNHPTKGDIIDYRNAVIEVGARFGIAVLDLYGTSGLYPENPTNYTTLVPDGRHPNEAGHRKMASRIIGFLKTL